MGKKTVKAPEDVDLFKNGGLNDEDADATCPAFMLRPVSEDHEHVGKYHERDTRRRNNVCYKCHLYLQVHT